MAVTAGKVAFRVTFVVLLVLLAFYVGRPLYWKLSATIHEIRESKHPYSVRDGLSHFVHEAQKSVGWFHDESDAGGIDDTSSKATNRRLLQIVGRKAHTV
ncbi:hypothetical protein AMTR_s00197p00035890 [Amborella trichopoda]|uniref:Uncharacterized protein n=2 Tax=Amborella trichopoda TaxID=13333 RepID=U5CYR5_AMBTC|nr:hypothetical protein AMTR_s00197p00035890 [Amborella trichopoda]